MAEGINFGNMAQNPVGGVVATLPQQPDPTNALVGGILQGMQTGQSIRESNQNIAASQQGMAIQKAQEDRNAQLFPVQKATGEVALQAAQLQLKTQQDAYNHLSKVQAAADQGEAAMLKAMRPDEQLQYKTAQATYQSTIATVAKTNAETKKQEMENSLMINDAIGTAYSAGASMEDDKNQQAAYSQVRQTLSPEIQKLMPEKYDPAHAMIAIKSAQIAQATYIAQNFAPAAKADTATTTQKDLAKAAELRTKVKNGTATPEDVQVLNGLQSTQVNQLRDEFNQQTNIFQKVNDAYGRIQAVGPREKDASGNEIDSPAGDLGLVYSYITLLDPNTGVKEGELATAKNAASIPEVIRNQYNKIVNGGTFTPKMRQDFISQAKNLYKSHEKTYEKRIEDYSKKADKQGLDPTDVISDVRTSKASATGQPTSESFALPDGRSFDMEAAMKATGKTKEQIIKEAGLKVQ